MIGGSMKSQECLGKFGNVISELYPKIYIHLPYVCLYVWLFYFWKRTAWEMAQMWKWFRFVQQGVFNPVSLASGTILDMASEDEWEGRIVFCL